MKYITSQSKMSSLVAFLLCILFVTAGCDEPKKPDNGGGDGGGDGGGTTDTPSAARITRQPASQTVIEGDTVRLSVSATADTGVTLSYQWQTAPKGSTTFTDVAEATSASYTTAPLRRIADSGVQYKVIVKATDTAGLTSDSIMSTIATISVRDPNNTIVWTDYSGKKQYSDAPANGILVRSLFEKENVVSIDFMPNTITAIAGRALMNKTGLTSIHIPSSVKSIGDSAFWVCTKLTSVTIPDGITSIGDYTFTHCSRLASISIPASVTSIGIWAFYDCGSLVSVDIPAGVTRIGESAFLGAVKLTSINIPNGVTRIEPHTFGSCTVLPSITLPDNLTFIGIEAFSKCKNLASVTIPASVTEMESFIFSRCENLTNVRVEAAKPPTVGSYIFRLNDDFLSVHPDLKITVPADSVDSYKNTHNWNTYKDKISGH